MISCEKNQETLFCPLKATEQRLTQVLSKNLHKGSLLQTPKLCLPWQAIMSFWAKFNVSRFERS